MEIMTKKHAGILSCSVAMLYCIYEYALRIYPSFIVRDLMRDIHIDATQIGLVGSFYYYSLAVMQFVVGPLFDRANIKLTLSLSAILCAITAYTFSISETLYALELSRLFMGIASACAFPASLYLIKDWSYRKQFTSVTSYALALLALFATFTAIGFPILLNYISWQSLAKWLSFSGLFVILMLILFTKRNTHAKPSNTIAMNQYFTDLLNAFKTLRFWRILFLAFFLLSPFVVFGALWGIEFLKDVHSFNTVQAGWIMAGFFIGASAGLLAMGLLAKHIVKQGSFLFYGFIISFLLSLSIIYTTSDNVLLILVLFFLLGFFSMAPNAILFYFAKEYLPLQLAGSALAITNFATLMPGVTLQTLVGYLLDKNWTGTMIDGAKIYSGHAFEIALSVIPICLFLGAVLSYPLRKS